MRNGSRIVPALLSVLLVCAAVAMAAPTTRKSTAAPKATTAPKAAAVPTAPPVDARSKAVLEKMCTFLAGTQAFTVDVNVTHEQVLPSGVKVQRNSEGQVSVQRPNMAQVSTDGDLLDRCFWYDGKTAAVLFPASNLYVKADAPSTLDGTMDWLIGRTGLAFPLMDYFYSDPLPGLLEGVRLSHYLGESSVMGCQTIHLAFKQPTINWQVWVEDSQTPVPRKIVVEYKTLPGCPEYTALLSDWEFPENIAASVFEFTPPEGAKQMPLMVPTSEVTEK
jgi:hypothetical protein